jgi:SlyX protein
MEQRLIDLEMRLAFQEQALQELDAVIVRQQRELEAVTRRLEQAESRLRGLTPSQIANQADETPPPHY